MRFYCSDIGYDKHTYIDFGFFFSFRPDRPLGQFQYLIIIIFFNKSAHVFALSTSETIFIGGLK